MFTQISRYTKTKNLILNIAKSLKSPKENSTNIKHLLLYPCLRTNIASQMWP